MKSPSIIFSVCAVLALTSTVAFAKRGSIGIYAIVDKVEFEPDENSPELVRISGLFVVPVPMSSGQYKAPQRGYLYFRIEPGMERAARREWANLKSLAGTGQAIGFAQYWVAHPVNKFGNPHHSLEVRVHPEGEVLVTPEVYPLSHARGIVKNGDADDPDFDRIVALLKAASH